MKVVILASGLGTMLSEESGIIPKPMVRNRRISNNKAYYEDLQSLWF